MQKHYSKQKRRHNILCSLFFVQKGTPFWINIYNKIIANSFSKSQPNVLIFFQIVKLFETFVQKNEFMLNFLILDKNPKRCTFLDIFFKIWSWENARQFKFAQSKQGKK